MTLRPDDLDPSLSPREHAALERMALRLEDERPLPAAGFRGDLRRGLVRESGRSPLAARTRRRLALGYLATGAALLALASAGLVGVGPLSPDTAAEAVAWLVSVG
jgi:hypothetical protein